MQKTIILLIVLASLLIIFTGTSHAWWTQPTEIDRIHQGTSDIRIQFYNPKNSSTVVYILEEINQSNLLVIALTALTAGNKVSFGIEGPYIRQIRIHSEDYQF